MKQHFLGCGVERADERLIQFRERFSQAFDDRFDGLFTLIEPRRKRLRQRFCFETCAEFVAPLKNFPRVEIVFPQQIGNVRRHEGKTRAGQYRGRPPEKFVVNQ